MFKNTSQQKTPLVLILMGPCGCGKSTIGNALAKKFSSPFIEGDDYHTKQNVEKMSHGISLTDEDRLPWLFQLKQKFTSEIANGSELVIVSCSALKSKYRKILRGEELDGNSSSFSASASYPDPDTFNVSFVLLECTEKTLMERLSTRRNHFMKTDQLKNQLETLEKPDSNEYLSFIVDANSEESLILDKIVKLIKICVAR